MKPTLLALVITLLPSPIVAGQLAAKAALIRDVASGPNFTLVVKADGSVVGWGRDPGGQAARPVSAKRVIPVPVTIDLPGKALKVALGDTTQYALLEDGTMVSWGTNDEGQLGNGPMGASGELGRYPKPSLTPVRVTGLTDIIQIEAGAKHAVALRKDGTVWAWGTRDDGAIGDGAPKTLRPVKAIGPTQVPGLQGITQIASAMRHNLALRSDGKVMAWGLNRDGQLGNGTRNPSPDDPGGRNLLPLQVPGLTGVKALSLGSGHVAALLGDGTLRMWGFDGYGQIGVGTSAGYYPKPVAVKSLTNVAAVYLGNMRSFVVRTDGSLWIWGYGSSGGQGILGKNLHVPTLLELP